VRWLLALTIVTGIAPQAPTHAGFMDAARLEELCRAEGPDSASARSLCLGYIVGAVDQVLNRSSRRGRPTVCPPADLTTKAVLQAVVRHSRFAATAKGIGAADFVRFAMEQAYPCPTERTIP
jgi:hypothetical protein